MARVRFPVGALFIVLADKQHMESVDWYIQEVIERGDQGSALLAARCAPTLNAEYVDVIRQGMNGIAVLRIPDGYAAVVLSA